MEASPSPGHPDGNPTQGVSLGKPIAALPSTRETHTCHFPSSFGTDSPSPGRRSAMAESHSPGSRAGSALPSSVIRRGCSWWGEQAPLRTVALDPLSPLAGGKMVVTFRFPWLREGHLEGVTTAVSLPLSLGQEGHTASYLGSNWGPQRSPPSPICRGAGQVGAWIKAESGCPQGQGPVAHSDHLPVLLVAQVLGGPLQSCPSWRVGISI